MFRRNDAALRAYPEGRRIRDRVPGGHWKMLMILGAMDHTGMPVDSLDLNSIEKAWSKLKARLRALAARAMPQLEPLIAQALQALTPKDAQAWLKLRFRNYT